MQAAAGAAAAAAAAHLRGQQPLGAQRRLGCIHAHEYERGQAVDLQGGRRVGAKMGMAGASGWGGGRHSRGGAAVHGRVSVRRPPRLQLAGDLAARRAAPSAAALQRRACSWVETLGVSTRSAQLHNSHRKTLACTAAARLQLGGDLGVLVGVDLQDAHRVTHALRHLRPGQAGGRAVGSEAGRRLVHHRASKRRGCRQAGRWAGGQARASGSLQLQLQPSPSTCSNTGTAGSRGAPHRLQLLGQQHAGAAPRGIKVDDQRAVAPQDLRLQLLRVHLHDLAGWGRGRAGGGRSGGGVASQQRRVRRRGGGPDPAPRGAPRRSEGGEPSRGPHVVVLALCAHRHGAPERPGRQRPLRPHDRLRLRPRCREGSAGAHGAGRPSCDRRRHR